MSDALLQSHSSVDDPDPLVRHWWVTPRINADVYDIFMVTYEMKDGKVLASRYLDSDGRWHSYEPMNTIVPCLSISGMFVAQASGSMINRGDIAASIQTLADKILKGGADGWD